MNTEQGYKKCQLLFCSSWKSLNNKEHSGKKKNLKIQLLLSFTIEQFIYRVILNSIQHFSEIFLGQFPKLYLELYGFWNTRTLKTKFDPERRDKNGIARLKLNRIPEKITSSIMNTVKMQKAIDNTKNGAKKFTQRTKNVSVRKLSRRTKCLSTILLAYGWRRKQLSGIKNRVW